ncbi:thioesterase domain-containing protein [Nonomuraea sp. NPDC003804]|uniref:thioesterase II family protein n=1 Tax=Nonomuraea sp. NPDC003804 TaxID=3154547 RepID=UPI00339F4567
MAPRGPLQATARRARTLFCLPFAGGGASAFSSLQRALTGLQVVALQLPGRENRLAEPPAFTVEEVADQIAPATTSPYALYGHSMGARLAFEVVRELRRRGLPPPARLYVGAAHPPHLRVPLAATADLPDEAFIDQLVRRAGALPELRDEPELRELMLPLLRSDMAWIKRYRYTPEPPLDTPVVAVAGLHDGEVAPPDMLGWARHTAAGFGLRTVRAGHLFVKDAPEELAHLITADQAEQVDGPEADEVHLWLADRPADAKEVLSRYGGTPVAGIAETGGLTLIAVTRDHRAGVALRLTTAAEPVELSELDPGEREQIEDAAEEDRHWLAQRAVTARRALVAGAGRGAPGPFADLGDGGPWQVDGWHVLHLPLHTPRGQAQAAVAVPYGPARPALFTLEGRTG